MELMAIISILVSSFCHCMGLFYLPLEASTDSFLFMIFATMFFKKIKNNNCQPQNPKGWLVMIFECVMYCVLIQVLLLVIWFPIRQGVQILVDSVCKLHCDKLRFESIDMIKGYTATGVVLAMELAVFLKVFDMDDIQRFFGSKDDLLSASVLAIVAEQQKIVERRERRRR